MRHAPILIASLFALIGIGGCGEGESYTVPRDTFACMDAHDYSVLLHQFGSVAALNKRAASLAATNSSCTVLHKGEVVKIVMGKPGEEVVMISRQASNNDRRMPSYLRETSLTYWANF